MVRKHVLKKNRTLPSEGKKMPWHTFEYLLVLQAVHGHALLAGPDLDVSGVVVSVKLLVRENRFDGAHLEKETRDAVHSDGTPVSLNC